VGAAHAAFLGLTHAVLGRFTETTRDFVWVAPITYTLAFLAFAIPLVVLRLFKPHRVTPAALLGWFGGLALFSLLLLEQRIHPWAWVAVSAGLGLRLSSVSAAGAWRAATVLGKLATGVYAICLLVGGVRRVVPWLGERSHLARDREAPADAPNVILLILDTVRAANFSLYGYERPTTPNFTRLANEGVAFDRAYSPAAWTLPSHAAMMTGVWAKQTGASYLSPTDDRLPTLAHALDARGYVTAGFMANAGWAGHEGGVGRGFTRFETHDLDVTQLLWSSTLTKVTLIRELIGAAVQVSPSRALRAFRSFDLKAATVGPAGGITAENIVGRFRRWRARIGDRHPYFAMMNMLDGHDPYVSPPQFRRRFNDGERDIDQYDGAIAYMDSVAGNLFDELRARGELDNTIVIVTSDHGELFNEHGLNRHGNSVYQNVVHVPLLIRYPARIPAGQRRADPVSLRNIAATILELAGVGEHDIPGHSLLTPEPAPALLLHASAGVRQPPEQPNATGEVNSILTGQWHLITNPDSSRQLFDWVADPRESQNRVREPASDTTVRGLLQRQADLLKR
jgi:arylsulfatase A-like enzyme